MIHLADQVRALIDTAPWDRFFSITKMTFSHLIQELCSTFSLQHVMKQYDESGTVMFRLEGVTCYLSISGFAIAIGIYFKDFTSLSTFSGLSHNIHHQPSLCWLELRAIGVTYNPSQSKATSLSPPLQFIHDILAHTLTSRWESIGVVDTNDAYFL